MNEGNKEKESTETFLKLTLGPKCRPQKNEEGERWANQTLRRSAMLSGGVNLLCFFPVLGMST